MSVAVGSSWLRKKIFFDKFFPKFFQMAVLDDATDEYRYLSEGNQDFRKVRIDQLNEIFRIEWEAYLNYDVEHNFATRPSDQRIYGVAVVHIPWSFSGGLGGRGASSGAGGNKLKVYSWGNHGNRQVSCFSKRLEFL